MNKVMQMFALLLILISSHGAELLKVKMISGEVSEMGIDNLNAIIFTDSTLVAQGEYKFSNIEKITFGEGLTVGISKNDKKTFGKSNNLKIWINENGLNFSLQHHTINSVQIYDIRGRSIIRKDQKEGASMLFKNLKISQGVYLIRITTDSEIITQAIQIKK